MLVECISGYCACGSACSNQRIQRGTIPRIKIVDFGDKGLGVISKEKIYASDFAGEYLGEVVTEEEYLKRQVVRK